ncbi:MAG: tetratricopeptide repeat protein [Armatimonadetes bacterium]|nr:tetratricopeptide repeat protein [Armatimonadota bacterium]
MEKLQEANTLRELFEKALSLILEELSPERAFIAYKEKGSQELTPQSTHGIDPGNIFTTGEISLEVIKQVLKTGEPLQLVDAIQTPGFANRTSVILSGLRSILCVPIKHPSGLVIGVIYADNRLKAGAFGDQHLSIAAGLARAVEERLIEIIKAHAGEADERPRASVDSPQERELHWQESRTTGIQHFKAGRTAEAEQHLLEAATLAEGFGPDDPRLGKSLGELAELYRSTQRLEEAERFLIRSMDIFERAGKHYHQDLAPSLNNLAGLYYSQGHPVRAEGLYRRALKIWEQTLEPSDGRLAPVLHNLGTLCREKSDHAEAVRLFSRALEVAEKAFGPDHPNTRRCRESYEQSRKLIES